MQIETQLAFYKHFASVNPTLHYCGVVTTDASWHQEPLYSSYSRLYYVTEGSGVLVSDNERITLEPGYVYLAPCGIKCGFYGTPSVTKLFFHINLSLSDDGSDVFENLGHFVRLPRSIDYINKLCGYYLKSDPYGYMRLKTEICKTICDFLHSGKLTEEKSDSFSPAVSESIRYIRSNLTATLSVKAVAEAALCSQSKLALLFKNEMGQSVSSYIEDLLMSEAQTLLMYSGLSIGEISEKLGFCDQFYFSRRFKKRFNVPPKEYRNSTR